MGMGRAAFQRMGIHLVRSTDEGINLLVDIDSGVSNVEKRPGAMERVMQTLGMKQPTGA